MSEHIHSDIDRFLDALPIPGFVFDLTTRTLLAVNRDFQRVMGYSAEELLSMRLDDLRPAEDVPLMLEALAKGPPEDVIRRRYRTKEGHLIWVSLKYRNMRYITNAGCVLDVRFTVVTDAQSIEANA